MEKSRFIPILCIGLLWGLFLPGVSAQNPYQSKAHQFLSFEKIPTWVALAADWEEPEPEIHLFDPAKYKGHAQYVSVGLKTGISFKQFKNQVQFYDSRKYIPFVLFDLREEPVMLSGKEYQWAIRMIDYEYQDNTGEMSETVIRLLNTVSTYIQKASGTNSNGLMVLSTNTKAAPNTSIASAVNQAGYPHLTRSQLLSKAGGKKVEVLNEGTGFGYLRYVRAEEEETFRPAPEDILIYESLPHRVPPVSGIITLEPQTPLSHINLLAKNRGTLNLYALDLKYLSGASSLIDRLVKVECSSKKIVIAPATEKEAKAYWAKRAVTVDIPQTRTTTDLIIDLNAYNTQQSVQHVGAKAANYGRIRQHFPSYVRPGFAIPFTPYFTLIQTCGADTLIEQLVQQKPDVEARNVQLKTIRERIRSAEVNPELLAQINHLIEDTYHRQRIRLRSSTNCEDLPSFNGAGLYVSKGFNADQGDKKLAKKILQVYASLWSELAFEEREFYLIDHEKAGMAILINQAYSDEYANGVSLTLPENGKLSLYVNSQFGENSVTNPENGQIPESLLFKSAKSEAYTVKSTSNIQDVFLQEPLKPQLLKLHQLSYEMHELIAKNVKGEVKVEYGTDIEFKIMKEGERYRLYIKQARLLRSVLPE